MTDHNDQQDYYMDVIDEIERVRTKNNKNWMDILRLAFRHAPEDAAAIMAEIYREDSDISKLSAKLTQPPPGSPD